MPDSLRLGDERTAEAKSAMVAVDWDESSPVKSALARMFGGADRYRWVVATAPAEATTPA